MGLLERLGIDSELWIVIMLAVPLEGVAGPGAYDDVERFGKSELGCLKIRVKDGVLQWVHATSSTKVQASIGKQIHHRKVLGDSDWMVHRENGHSRAEPHALGSLRSRREQ